MAETKHLGIGLVQARGTDAVKAWADNRNFKKARAVCSLVVAELLIGVAIATRVDETFLSLLGAISGTSLTALSTLFILVWSRSRSATTSDVAEAAAEANIPINLLRITRRSAEIELCGRLTVAQVTDFVNRLASIDRFDLEQVSFMQADAAIPGPEWLRLMQTRLAEYAVYSGEVTPADAPEPEKLVRVGGVVGIEQPKPGPRPTGTKTASPPGRYTPNYRKPNQPPQTLK